VSFFREAAAIAYMLPAFSRTLCRRSAVVKAKEVNGIDHWQDLSESYGRLLEEHLQVAT
jgi:hypothetical protein